LTAVRQKRAVDKSAGEMLGVAEAAKQKTQQPAEPTAMRFLSRQLSKNQG